MRLALIAAHPGFVEQNAAELASLVLEAVKTYNTHKLQRVVLGVARSAMKSSDVFVKALAAAIVKACSSGLTASKPSALSRHEMFGILALIKLAMGSLDPETAKKAVQKLLEVQSLLADALMGVPLRWQVWYMCMHTCMHEGLNACHDYCTPPLACLQWQQTHNNHCAQQSLVLSLQAELLALWAAMLFSWAARDKAAFFGTLI